MRDATLLRLISEAETLLTQLGATDFAQAQRLVELVAKLREADVRARVRLRDRLEALLEARAEDAQHHVALADRLTRMETALHGQAHKNQSIVARLDAALNALVDEGRELSAVSERLARIEAMLQKQAVVADRLERIEGALQTQASVAERLERVEAALQAQAGVTERLATKFDALEKGQEGLHLDNAAKLKRDEALAARVGQLTTSAPVTSIASAKKQN